jgi:hypothetical protein
LFNVPSIGEDFVIGSLELIGARLEHFRNDIWSFPWWDELVAVLVDLDKAMCQVPDVEGMTLDAAAMVPTQRLLVLGRVEEGNVACFIKLIHGILKERLGLLLLIHHDPRCSIVKVGWEDHLRAIDHEEGRVACRPAGGCSQTPKHCAELHNPSPAKFVVLVEYFGLDALQNHVVRTLNLLVRARVHHSGLVDTM